MTLLGSIERYLKKTGIPATRFGREAVGDPRLVHDLRNGRRPRASMAERVHAFMEGQG